MAEDTERMTGEDGEAGLAPATASNLIVRRPPYRVRLDLFEGPLDLLLHLIKKNEVAVTDIPVATITEQYLGYLDLLRELNLDVAGEYLVMAATLLLIKSRMLLPAAETDEEDEEADPRADLVRRLLEYQRFREAAQALAERRWLGRDVFGREPGLESGDESAEPRPVVRATAWELLEAFRAVLKRARPEAVHEVTAEPVSLRERVQSLLRALSVARSLTFDSLFTEDATRPEVIVTFLALLELVKLGAVEAVQEALFGTIMIVLRVQNVDAVSIDLIEEYDGAIPGVEEERYE